MGSGEGAGTPHNTGDGLLMALELGAADYGLYSGCHATPMDLHMADFGNLDLPPGERKNYRKISYFLGVMLNAHGARFVDEGANFRNYTYAQYGAAILEQPGQFAWQVFDSKTYDLLYDEYRFKDAHFVKADRLEDLIAQMSGVDQAAASKTLARYNAAVDQTTGFDPTVLDGKATVGLNPQNQIGHKPSIKAFLRLSGHRRHHIHLWRFKGGCGGQEC
ncbi:hypothetical protein [Planktomarina sp.]|uniref:hypothetical protein n=1 Tax=Planktomarina sp. TaxID=2024851 RepID=UPI0032613654